MTPSSPRSPHTRRLRAVLVAASVMIAMAVAPAASAAPTPALNLDFGCAKVRHAGQMHCLGKVRARWSSKGKLVPQITSGPVGLGPADLQSAYKLAGIQGSGRTVA